MFEEVSIKKLKCTRCGKQLDPSDEERHRKHHETEDDQQRQMDELCAKVSERFGVTIEYDEDEEAYVWKRGGTYVCNAVEYEEERGYGYMTMNWDAYTPACQRIASGHGISWEAMNVEPLEAMLRWADKVEKDVFGYMVNEAERLRVPTLDELERAEDLPKNVNRTQAGTTQSFTVMCARQDMEQALFGEDEE